MVAPRAIVPLLAATLTAASTCAAESKPVIVLDKMTFGAIPAGLTVGQVVEFRNADIFEHTATAPGDFDLDLKPGQSGEVPLHHAGTMTVTCRFHPTMKIVLTVGPEGKP